MAYTKEEQHQWYLDNREAISKRQVEHYVLHRKAILKRQAEYRAAHRKEIQKKQAEYRAAHREERRTKHAEFCARRPLYLTWNMMLQRCTNPNANNFQDYGGRGITVCARGRTFKNFEKDMSPRPLGKTLDRINNYGNYEPGNVRWATAKEQAQNRRKPCRSPK